MNKEMLEMVKELEFDEIRQALEMEIGSEQMKLLLQKEAERRCKVTVEQVQQQLSYLVNTELTIEEAVSDVLNVLEGADLGIDIQNAFTALEEIDGQIEGLYPCCYESSEGDYCGGLVGIVIELEIINEESTEEDEDVCEWGEETEELVITDVNVYYSSPTN